MRLRSVSGFLGTAPVPPSPSLPRILQLLIVSPTKMGQFYRGQDEGWNTRLR